MASVACEIWGFLVSSDFFGILYQLSSRGFEIPMHFLGTSVCMPLHTRAWPACSAPDSSKKEGPCATIRWQPHAFGQLGGKGAAGARHLRCRAHVIVLANTRITTASTRSCACRSNLCRLLSRPKTRLSKLLKLLHNQLPQLQPNE